MGLSRSRLVEIGEGGCGHGVAGAAEGVYGVES